MKKDKRKIFIVSVLVFLLWSGGISTFFIFKGIEDLKENSKFSFENASFPRKVLLTLLTKANFIDNEKGVNPEVIMKAREGKLNSLTNGELTLGDKAAILFGSNNRASINERPFIPNSKINSSIAGRGSMSGSGSSTSSSGSFSKSGDSKALSAGANVSSSQLDNSKSGKLVSRLSEMKTMIQDGLKTGSGTQARYKWDQSFVGAMSPSKKAMYNDSMVKLDKIKGEVVDLKAANADTLKAPEPGMPEVDNTSSANGSGSPKENLENQLKQSLVKGMVNPLLSSAGSAISDGIKSDNTTRGGTDPEVVQKVESKFNQWNDFLRDEDDQVKVTKYDCTNQSTKECSTLGYEGDTLMVATYSYPDSKDYPAPYYTLVTYPENGNPVVKAIYKDDSGNEVVEPIEGEQK